MEQRSHHRITFRRTSQDKDQFGHHVCAVQQKQCLEDGRNPDRRSCKSSPKVRQVLHQVHGRDYLQKGQKSSGAILICPHTECNRWIPSAQKTWWCPSSIE